DSAKESIDIVIFRFDHREIERALVRAVNRKVHVRALIAYTNKGGEKNLRALELRLLAAGVTVARTADDLIRYHGKMLIVDRREAYILAFNYTHVNIERTRSFGIVSTDKALVQEAMGIFEADMLRESYEPGSSGLVISPLNARSELGAFIKGAKKELCI